MPSSYIDSRAPLLAVCGSGWAEGKLFDLAYELGREIALAGAILLCGGLGGTMSASAKGAFDNGGLTIGILPGAQPETANPYIKIPLATGLGHARNTVIVTAAQAVIALPGGPGTLSEIGLGLKNGRPVFGLQAWEHIEGVIKTKKPEQAVKKALVMIESS